MPGPGTIARLAVPEGEHVRFDSLLYEGYAVPPFYDSLLGKLVVRGADRDDCLARLRGALDALHIDGVPTTIALHRALALEDDVIGGRVHTRFLEPWLEGRFAGRAGS
jgi:acetyl-CoA carboxylase biotin carboxylase subunit